MPEAPTCPRKPNTNWPSLSAALLVQVSTWCRVRLRAATRRQHRRYSTTPLLPAGLRRLVTSGPRPNGRHLYTLPYSHRQLPVSGARNGRQRRPEQVNCHREEPLGRPAEQSSWMRREPNAGKHGQRPTRPCWSRSEGRAPLRSKAPSRPAKALCAQSQHQRWASSTPKR